MKSPSIIPKAQHWLRTVSIPDDVAEFFGDLLDSKIKSLDGAKAGGKAKRDSTIAEDQEIARVFRKHLTNPLRGSGNTVSQIHKAIAEKRRTTADVPKPHSESGVRRALERECARGGRIGLHNPGQCNLPVCHCQIIEDCKR